MAKSEGAREAVEKLEKAKEAAERERRPHITIAISDAAALLSMIRERAREVEKEAGAKTARRYVRNEAIWVLIEYLKRDWFALFASLISILGAAFALVQAWTSLAGLIKFGSLTTSAYAAVAVGGRVAEPVALIVFQVVIALMISVFVIGAFYILINGSTPEARKMGRDILIATMGFVLGAATRLL